MSSIELKDLPALRAFAESFLTQFPDGGVFALRGDLGVGKTSFVRDVVTLLAERAGGKGPRVVSPSYVLHQLYVLDPTVDHFDLYRLESLTEESLMEIGYFEALDRVEYGGYCFVEWPERLPETETVDRTLKFEFAGAGRRVEII